MQIRPWAYLGSARIAQWLFDRLELGKYLRSARIVLKRGKPRGESGRFEGDSAIVYTGYDLETVERTIMHELYHIAAGRLGAGGEVGARTVEYLWVLKRLAKRGKFRSIGVTRNQLHSWILWGLTTYPPFIWGMWEYLAVKHGVRRMGQAAYEIFRGREDAAPVVLALMARYASVGSLTAIARYVPELFREVYRARPILTEEERLLVGKKLWLAAKRIMEKPTRRYEDYKIVADILVGKQLLEGATRLNIKEVYAITHNSSPDIRSFDVRMLKKAFRESARELTRIWREDRKLGTALRHLLRHG